MQRGLGGLPQDRAASLSYSLLPTPSKANKAACHPVEPSLKY
ncbi:hypothetical protein [Moorena sp. SIO1F2]|nr:hypothetical protein [Moorena sp. SIO1F2]